MSKLEQGLRWIMLLWFVGYIHRSLKTLQF